ncbi:MAG: alpha/beta hydrolase [Saprospiraceae bacterium]|nr:alpha/beta hydrolase [Saprospiraceae bacterium]
MSKFAVIFILLLYSLQNNGQRNYNSTTVFIEVDDAKIFGTLNVPESETAVPVVLIISGSGPTDRDGNNASMKNNSLKMWADTLATQGIASLRYDKRGIGESIFQNLSEEELRIEHFMDDAKSWITMLRKDNRFSKVIVAGHSEGSLLGMVAAKEAKADAYISVAGIAVKASEVLLKQIEANAPILKDQSGVLLDSLSKGFKVENVNPFLQSLFRKSVQPYLISWFRYNPSQIIADMQIPILVVQGTHDIQVETENGTLLVQANKKAELAEIEGMNHILKIAPADRNQNIKTYNDPDLPLAPQFVNETVRFLLNL